MDGGAFETDGRISCGDDAVDGVEVTIAGEISVVVVGIGADIVGNNDIEYIVAGLDGLAGLRVRP